MTGRVAESPSPRVDKSPRVDRHNQNAKPKGGVVKTRRRPYIISNFKGQRKLVKGVTCGDLLSSGCKLFDMCPSDCRLALEDGSEVDDEYLAMCGDYTALVILGASEHVKYSQVKAREMIGRIGRMLASGAEELSQALGPLKNELVSHMMAHVQSLQSPSHLLMADSREEDPHWFQGEKRATSKKSVLRERAKTRIRGYYYKSKEEMQKRLGEGGQGWVQQLFGEFLQRLRRSDHNGHYFVRGEPGALCLGDGHFGCQGPFSSPLCPAAGAGTRHAINPYSSREQLVLFSTWNLDHRVERSRSVLPSLGQAVREARGRALNADYFYRLLFTTDNLKLVHPVCHVKAEHAGCHCDPRRWYQ